MDDLDERPAVPPFDPQGDPRAGCLAAGGLLVALGWGAGVVANVLLHRWAPAGGWRWFGVYLGPTMGAYAWATFGLGLATGAIGLALIGIGRGLPRGRLVLPGTEI